MPSENFNQGLAVFLASYAKRFLEKSYDHLSQTELMEKIKSLPSIQKHGIEFILNALTAVFERNFGEETAFKKFIKEVGEDAGPELSKRIMNGGSESKIFEKTLNGNSEEKEILQTLLAMDQESLLALLNWLHATPPEEQKRLMKKVAVLSPLEIQNLIRVPLEQRELLTALLWGAPRSKTDYLEPIVRRLQTYINRRHKEKGETP